MEINLTSGPKIGEYYKKGDISVALSSVAPLIDETSSYFPLLNYEVLYRVYKCNHSNQGEIADLN